MDEEPESANVGDITLRSRQRLRSSSPARLRAKASKVFMTRSARMRMRASVVVPGVSEGVLPPNAKPVTAQEALHHLSKIVRAIISYQGCIQKLEGRIETCQNRGGGGTGLFILVWVGEVGAVPPLSKYRSVTLFSSYSLRNSRGVKGFPPPPPNTGGWG